MYGIMAGYLMICLAPIPIFIVAMFIDNATGWAIKYNRYDDFAQVSNQAQIVGALLVFLATIVLFFLLRRSLLFRKLSIDTLSKSIVKSKSKTIRFLVIFGLASLLFFELLAPWI